MGAIKVVFTLRRVKSTISLKRSGVTTARTGETNMKAKLILLLALIVSLVSSANGQFTNPDAPGFLTTGQWQQATNGRSFALAPLTLTGGRLDLLNQNWLSWGAGGLFGRELLYEPVGDVAFGSMSFGAGAWGQISFGSVGDLTFGFGASLHMLFCDERPDSFAGALYFSITGRQ